MSLQEDAKRLLPLVQAATEGKKLKTMEGKSIEIDLEGVFWNNHCGIRFDCVRIVELPKLRPWNSIEEMGEAVNHWFRQKNTIVKLKVEAVYLETIDLSDEVNRSAVELFNNYEHTATPWLADSWKPCGVEEEVK